MRADRLLSMLMLLQTRGRCTAQELARELEVSERTIYRDLEALSLAGVPVYAERGPGGGCGLVDNYRTTLTGLTEAEVRALFTLSLPTPLEKLGLTPELKQARLKLLAALPTAQRSAEERARQHIYLDSNWWFQADEPLPHLQTLYQAVWQDRQVQLTYRLKFGTFIDTPLEWVVSPYGLVAKTNVWYLVCARDEKIYAYPVAAIVQARLLESRAERPPDFDLAAFWQNWCADFEHNRPRYPVTLRLAPDFAPALPDYYGGEQTRALLAQAGPPDADGWLTITLEFESFEDARARLLSWGGAAQALAPEPLRRSLRDYAEQITRLYSTG